MAKSTMYGTKDEFVSESDSIVARLGRGMIERDGLETAVGAKRAGDGSQTMRLQEVSVYPVVASYDETSHAPVKLSSNHHNTTTTSLGSPGPKIRSKR